MKAFIPSLASFLIQHIDNNRGLVYREYNTILISRLSKLQFPEFVLKFYSPLKYTIYQTNKFQKKSIKTILKII